MGKVIAIVNQKGGVGKTTTCTCLGAGLVRNGKKVLCVDADRGGLTVSLGIKNFNELENTLTNAMMNIINDVESDDSAILHSEEGMDFVPSNARLTVMDIQLVNAMCREYVLKRYIDMIKDDYDYVLIDSGPTLGMMMINILACADYVLIPVESEYLPVVFMQDLLASIAKVKRQLNGNLKILGILITMVDLRTRDSKEIMTSIREYFDGKIKVFDTYIPISVRLKEMPKKGVSIFKHDPNGTAKKAYETLSDEIIKLTEEE